MVKLLLAITLASGSALAASNKFQRRAIDNQVQSSGSHSHHYSTTLGGFGDKPDEDAFDDLEARAPPVRGFASLAAKVASRFVKGGAPKESQHAVRPNLNGQQHAGQQHAGQQHAGQQHAGQPHAGQQQEGQHAVGPHGGPPQSQNVGPHGGPPQGQHVGPHEGQQGGVDRLNQASIVANIGSSAAMAISIFPKSSSSSGSSDSSQDVQTSGSSPTGNLYTRRELEDNEDPFKRDLDVEELFGRESYPLDERDVVDNGDLFVRDFGTGELFGREYDFLDERDIIDDEDLFVRDLEAEEFFGREYDFLD